MLRKDISSETDNDMTSRPDSDKDMTDIQTSNDRLTDDSHASRRGPSLVVTAGLGRETHTLTTHSDRQLVSPVAEGPVSRRTLTLYCNTYTVTLTLQCIAVKLTL